MDFTTAVILLPDVSATIYAVRTLQQYKCTPYRTGLPETKMGPPTGGRAHYPIYRLPLAYSSSEFTRASNIASSLSETMALMSCISLPLSTRACELAA